MSGTVDGQTWFDSREIPRSAINYTQTIQLQRQLLSPPMVATTDDGDAIGAVTVWRAVQPADPREQVFYTECIQTTPTDSPPYWTLENRRQALTEGTVSLTVPDSILIGYRDSNITVPTGTLPLASLQQSADRDTVAEWHSLRGPSIPMFETSSSDAFSIVTKTETRKNADPGWLTSFLSFILGGLGSFGTLGLLVDILGLVLSIPDPDDSEIDSVNLVTAVPPIDLNDYDIVSNSWSYKNQNEQPDPSVVVHQTPVRFEPDDEVTVVIGGGWRTANGHTGRFEQAFSVTRTQREFVEYEPDASRLPYVIRVEDVNRSTTVLQAPIEYTLEVTGELRRVQNNAAAEIESGDRLQQGIVFGQLDDDADAYRFSGSILALDITVPESTVAESVRITLNGDVVDPEDVLLARPEHELQIVATSSECTYRLEVTHTLAVAALESSPNLHPRTAHSELSAGTDTYRYSGEIATFELEGTADVYLDGLQIDPMTLAGD